MQLGGVGVEHSASMHQVTECMHNHAHGMKAGSGSVSTASGAAAQAQQTEALQEMPFSLSAWLEKTLGRGKRVLGNIWGSNAVSASGEEGGKSDTSQVMAQISGGSIADGVGANVTGEESRRQDASLMMHTPQIAAAATAIKDPQTMRDNPYFTAVEDTAVVQETLWRKVKVKFKDIAGQLAGHLPGKFFNFQAKNSFQEKQEQPKEDLRKRSKYRRDEVEIDCVLTDDSYLLDSYDRKGAYSRLSAGK